MGHEDEKNIQTHLIANVNNMIRAHLLDILTLALTVRERPNFCTHCLGEQNSIMPKATYTNNTNLLSRAAAVSKERRVDGEAGAEHRGCIFGGDTRWNGEYKLLVGANSSGVSIEGNENQSRSSIRLKKEE